ncbi:MAG: tetratricopeptide repeat protein [Planctomycetes bacterium]|nr:tetratricopeptide repeat protein [Planctomycetota bacterium]
MTSRAAAGVLLLAAILGAGCAGPVVHIRHVISGGVPLRGEAAEVRAGKFTVRGWSGEDLQGLMRDLLEERYGRAVPLASGRPCEVADVLEVGGTIHVQAADTSGTRTVRRRDPAAGQAVAVSLPTLVRTVAVKANFVLARPGTAEAPVTVEVAREYRSSEDPAVRGDYGLERADDPARAPPTNLIVRRLLGECAAALSRALAPGVVEADVTLRPGGGPPGDAGRQAAARGDWAAARSNFQDAIARAPDDVNLLFNLAVTREAAGDLDAAHAAYAEVVKISQDAEARRGAVRTSRLIERRSQITGRL